MRFVSHIANLTVRLSNRQVPHYHPTTVCGSIQEGGVGGMEMNLLNGLVRGEDSLGTVREMGIPEKAVALIVVGG